MFIANYLGLLHGSEIHLRDSLKKVAEHHKNEPDIEYICKMLASWSEVHIQNLERFLKQYEEHKESEPDKLQHSLFQGTRKGGLGLLRDLHDLYLLASEVELSYMVILQASQALRDKELENFCRDSVKETERQVNWLKTRIKQSAPQSLVAAG
ncbi:MAG: molybdopterin oxidoreductase [Ignavibacteria bacterium]|nr:molybdopterin oxidoreductase [Ignavibacteria bacterium]MCU7504899.1 molybdopterin oxidoreductase [Ignavibacteria bacterium]MCU7517809.1 molybdopterin oxidoreductase [Ignavibacteria bacterium]